MTYVVLLAVAVVAACGGRERAAADSAVAGRDSAPLATATDTTVRDTTVQAPVPGSASAASPAGTGAPSARRATSSASTVVRTPAPTAQSRRTRATTAVSPEPARDTAVPRSAATQQDVDREIGRAVAAWRAVRTLRATFQQTVMNPLTGSELNSRGELQQQKPGKLAIRFTDPAGDRIISDGEFVWVYLQSATPGQVVRMRVTDVGAANTDLIGQFLNTPRSKYDATDAGADRVGDRPARAIILVAKPGQVLPFIRAKVWIDGQDALIRQFDAVDANGISRKVRILTMSPNAAVDAAAFKFDVPQGMRVIER